MDFKFATRLTDWLSAISRAVFVIQFNVEEGGKLTDYARLTIRGGIEAIKNVRQHLDKVQAAFEAVLKS